MMVESDWETTSNHLFCPHPSHALQHCFEISGWMGMVTLNNYWGEIKGSKRSR